jgi:hypothetical protein
VNKRLGMYVLDTRDQLVGQQEDRFERELAVAKVEQVLQAGAEKIEDHGIVVTFSAKPTHERNSHTTSERFVDSGFIFELRVLGLNTLQLNGNLFTGDDVGAEVDITERAGADLSTDTVLVTNAEIL